MRTSFKCRGRRIGWAATVLVVASIAFAALAAEDDTVVDIPDPALRAAIESALDKEADAPITVAEMESLGSLYATYRDIAVLTGLEHATGLTNLGLTGNRIADVTPLADLTSLVQLILLENQIADVTPLADLTSLVVLDLRENQIADVTPLAGLTSLTRLHLATNQLTDVTPLAEMTFLTGLSLFDNQITDVTALADMTSLDSLWLHNNQISDVTALSNMTSLTLLILANNHISDVTALADMTSLVLLALEHNQIPDISSLANITSLTQLYLSGNRITDVTALADMTSLTGLRLDSNQIADVTPLADMTSLTHLWLQDNQITDIAPLANLRNLEALSLDDNEIDTVTLTDMAFLASLSLSDNRISDIALANLSSLRSLNVERNRISEITLDGLTSLFRVEATGNNITDLSSLAEPAGLVVLFIGENRVSDLSPLSGWAYLETLDATSNEIADVAPLAGLEALSSLGLSGNAITDISPLSGLPSLRFLTLYWNRIADVRLVGLPNLSTLVLGGNQITDLSGLADLPSLQFLDVSYNRLADMWTMPMIGSLSSLNVSGNRIVDLGPLRGLAGLSSLGALGNEIEDLSALSEMQLSQLNVGGNNIEDVSPLASLTDARSLGLYGNQIADVAPLTSALGDGDGVALWANPLSAESLDVHIPTMVGNGVVVAEVPEARYVPLVPPASDEARQGFIRLTNHSETTGSVQMRAVDDAARDRWTIVPMSEIRARMFRQLRSIHVNSNDLEEGSVAKRMFGTGAGEGDWRLELYSNLDFEVAAYMRTRDGFLTSMHDVAPHCADGHWVAIFNPGSNPNQESRLRIVNAGHEAANVTISGVDDAGQSPGTEVSARLPAGSSRTFTAAELEAGTDLAGALGDGAGKWQLHVASDQPVDVLSLMSTPTGHLTNLSTAPTNAMSTTGGTLHSIPLFPPARDAEREGFARVVNHGDVPGEVVIEAYDDAGMRHGPVTLAVPAGETVHFNSMDLEAGNEDKGLSGGVGSGTGSWRLDLTTSLDTTVLSYVRTTDGFLTVMHDTAPQAASDVADHAYRVPIFNPGSNRNQVSELRLVNPTSRTAAVTIIGIDDYGESPGGDVTVSVPAGAARTVTAQQLESGDGVDGAIGDGHGKWELAVASDQPILVMSLLRSPTGHLTNLSTAPGRMAAGGGQEGAPTTAAVGMPLGAITFR